MKITYDAETDSLTIVLRETSVRESEEVAPGTIVDFDEGHRLVAIEILDASRKVDGVDTVQFQISPRSAAVAAE